MARRRRFRRAVGRAVSGAYRRAKAKAGPNIQAIKSNQRTRTVLIGGASAAGFGLVQSWVNLPSLSGLPDTLVYGTGAMAVGLLARSPVITDIATGPFFAGLHHIALHGVGQAVWGDRVGGEFDQLTTGGEFDQSSGYDERETVTAGDFDDL